MTAAADQSTAMVYSWPAWDWREQLGNAAATLRVLLWYKVDLHGIEESSWRLQQLLLVLLWYTVDLHGIKESSWGLQQLLRVQLWYTVDLHRIEESSWAAVAALRVYYGIKLTCMGLKRAAEYCSSNSQITTMIYSWPAWGWREQLRTAAAALRILLWYTDDLHGVEESSWAATAAQITTMVYSWPAWDWREQLMTAAAVLQTVLHAFLIEIISKNIYL